MAEPLLDARGVAIAPGDAAIYGFGVGRSIAMAEAVVLGAHADHKVCLPPCQDEVSLTPSGRVRLRVIRRSYSSGEKPIVDVAPDRLVVLKFFKNGPPGMMPFLPPSLLPTQGEMARKDIETQIRSYTEDLRSEVITWGESYFADLAEFHAYAAKRLAKLRKKLKALDE